MSEVLTEILRVDPAFDKERFLQQCENDIIPNVLEVGVCLAGGQVRWPRGRLCQGCLAVDGISEQRLGSSVWRPANPTGLTPVGKAPLREPAPVVPCSPGWSPGGCIYPGD